VKKASFIGLLLFALCINIFCEDWEFIVIKDTPISLNLRPDEVLAILNVGASIVSSGGAYIVRWDDKTSPPYMTLLPLDNLSWITIRHYIDARDVIPANTNNLFNSDMLADKNTFLASYTLDILQSRNRETLLTYETRDNHPRFDFSLGRDVYWYEDYGSNDARFFPYNSMLGFGFRWSLIVNTIKKTKYGYIIKCMDSLQNQRHRSWMNTVRPTLAWELTEGKSYFYLLIHIDGDYIDLYIDNTSNKLGTFFSASDEFVKQFNNLIKTNTCDLTNVIWPQRAEGSAGYFNILKETDFEKIVENDVKNKNIFWILTVIGIFIIIISAVLRKKMLFKSNC